MLICLGIASYQSQLLSMQSPKKRKRHNNGTLLGFGFSVKVKDRKIEVPQREKKAEPGPDQEIDLYHVDAETDTEVTRLQDRLLNRLVDDGLHSGFLTEFQKRVEATSEESEDRVADIIKAKNPDTEETFLMWAARNNELALCKELLRRKARVDESSRKGMTALNIAASKGYFEVCKLLFKSGARVDKRSCSATPLLSAAKRNSYAICALFIPKSKAIDTTNSQGFTPLMYAAAHGNTRLCELLLHNGADIQKACKKKMTALMRAVHNGSIEACRVLLAAGAEVNVADQNGNSVLHYAINAGNLHISHLLLQHKADLFVLNQRGETPLICAALGRNLELANLLIIHAFAVRKKEVFALLGSLMCHANQWNAEHAEAAPHLLYKHRKKLLYKHIVTLLDHQQERVYELLTETDEDENQAYDYFRVRILNPVNIDQIAQEIIEQEDALDAAQELARRQRPQRTLVVRDGKLVLG